MTLRLNAHSDKLGESKTTTWPKLEEDLWEDLSQEIPTKDDPFFQKYVTGREALIAQEKRQRSDHSFRQSLSPIARDACDIVERIRRQEMATVWTSDLEQQLAEESKTNLYPGMMFSLAKDRMESTKLWQIMRKLPKGALLHAHMDALVDFDWLLEVLLGTPGMQISCAHDLSTADKRADGLLCFAFKKKDLEEVNIWSNTYEKETPVPIARAADTFPDGGRPGFLRWLKDRLTITNVESLEHHHGLDAVWRKFQSIFIMVNGITFYEPIFRQFLRRMMHLFLADGVRWVDLRMAFAVDYFKEGQEVPEPTFDRFFQVLDEEINRFKNSEEGKTFWGMRMIWTGIRAFDTRAIIADMDACITMKLAYPHLICGYDLVGQEDKGRPLKDILPELFWFRKQCAQESVNLPFFFHAGETLGDGSETDQNLFDAILLGTRRIGHGFSLYKHPLLIDMVKEKKILIESCPISNEILRLCNSIISHPLPALLARGVVCALCNDDPAILGQDTAGMTHDYWQAIQGWDNLGLAGLGSLAENSVRYATFEDETNAEYLTSIKEASTGNGIRAQRMKEWAVEWEEFCLWVVTEYGEDSEDIREAREKLSVA